MGNKFIECCGPCEFRFHVNCLQFSEKEYAYYTVAGVPTYRGDAYAKSFRSQRNDDTPVKRPSSSTSDLPEKSCLSRQGISFAPVFDSDKYEALSVQLKTGRHNGIFTTDLIKSISDTVHKFSEDVIHRKLLKQLKRPFSRNLPGVMLLTPELRTLT
jgi:hypothetical protein